MSTVIVTQTTAAEAGAKRLRPHFRWAEVELGSLTKPLWCNLRRRGFFMRKTKVPKTAHCKGIQGKHRSTKV
jgi:hypothetical protein